MVCNSGIETIPDVPNLHAATPLETYDFLFQYPIPDELCASGVRLTPYCPSVHGMLDYAAFHDGREETAAVFRYLPYGPFHTYQDFLTQVETLRSDPGVLYFAVYNTADSSEWENDGVFAGTLAFLNTQRRDARSEIGHIRFLPEAQRTHVSSQAIGLLLEHAFQIYRMRRVQWFANALNEPSIHAAKRLGFIYEGTLRWHRILPKSKAELQSTVLVPQSSVLGSPECGPGRHSALLAITWEDWRDGTRENVLRLMARAPVRLQKS